MDKLTLDGIADYVGLNREYLSRLFSKETGTGLFQYINEVRMKRAGEMIRSNKQVYIKEVAAAVGFDDPYFFSRKFKDFMGKRRANMLKRKGRIRLFRGSIEFQKPIRGTDT